MRPLKIFRTAVIVAFFGFALANATPALSFFCGVKIIGQGMRASQVIAACGYPTWHETRYIFEKTATEYPNSANSFSAGESFVPIALDEWVYNFGSTALMQQLTFRNGVLIGVQALDYGE